MSTEWKMVPDALTYAAKARLAVTKEWARGWDDCLAYALAASPQPAAQPERFITYAHCTGGARFRQSINDPLPAWAYDVRLDEPEQPEPGVLTDERLRQIHHEDQFGLFCDYDDFEQIARAVEREVLSARKLSDEQVARIMEAVDACIDAESALQEGRAGWEDVAKARAEVEHLLHEVKHEPR